MALTSGPGATVSIEALSRISGPSWCCLSNAALAAGREPSLLLMAEVGSGG